MSEARSVLAPLERLRGVGPRRAKLLQRLGLRTVEDLLLFFPHRYEDRRKVTPIKDVQPERKQLLLAQVLDVRAFSARGRRLEVVEALLFDGTGYARAVWFNRRDLSRHLRPGSRYFFYGKAVVKDGRLYLQSPEVDEEEGTELSILPVYPTTQGLTQRFLRFLVSTALEEHADLLEETVPEEIRQRRGLMPLREAVRELHFPRDEESWRRARRSVAFEELFLLQVALALRRRAYSMEASPRKLVFDGPLLRSFLSSLPFSLTAAQRRVLQEIASDCAGESPMNRLLQGDVGSGKTVVAFAAMLAAVDSGAQAALMAPTEILAQQHFEKLSEALYPLGIVPRLLVGSLKNSARQRALAELESGECPLAVGTHALIEEDVRFKELALVVVDEQHRFGVLQRGRLMAKGLHPHVLVMTATPIPRTLALTVYGDLAVSVIDEMPPGRKPVTTRWVREEERGALLRFLERQVREGRQVYWVCPLIEESEKVEAQNAVETFERLRRALPHLRIGLVHGQMRPQEREEAMREFKSGRLDLLVSTTVIEVGVDVPNATVMVIEDAWRFGLAQLHQLRGRVGRSSLESFCFLLGDPPTEEGKRRIEVLCSTSDGFEIAEEDLRMRGPGQICGTRQHGVTEFRVANLIKDMRLLEVARSEAQALVERDPGLAAHPNLRRALSRRLGEALDLAFIS